MLTVAAAIRKIHIAHCTLHIDYYHPIAISTNVIATFATDEDYLVNVAHHPNPTKSRRFMLFKLTYTFIMEIL